MKHINSKHFRIIILLLFTSVLFPGCFMPLYTSFLTNEKGTHSLYIGATGTCNPYRDYETPIVADSNATSLSPDDIGSSRTKIASLGYRYSLTDKLEIGPNILIYQFGKDYNKQTIRPGIGLEWKANFHKRLTVAGTLGCMYREHMNVKKYYEDSELDMLPFQFIWSYAFFGGISFRYGKEFAHGQILSFGPYLSLLSTNFTYDVFWKSFFGTIMLGAGYEKNIGRNSILVNAQYAPITGTIAISLSAEMITHRKKQLTILNRALIRQCVFD